MTMSDIPYSRAAEALMYSTAKNSSKPTSSGYNGRLFCFSEVLDNNDDILAFIESSALCTTTQ